MTRRINLIPPSERTRTTTDVGLLVMLAVCIVVVFSLGLGYYLLTNQLADKEQELTQLQQQVTLVEAEVESLRQYEVIQAQRVAAEAVAQGIYSARTIVSGILDDISLVIPNTIWFQNLGLTVADPVVTFGSAPAVNTLDPTAGTTLSVEGKTYTFEDVAQLLVRFELVPSLRDVELSTASDDSSEDLGTEVKTFTLKGLVVDDSPEEVLPLSEIQVDAP